MTCSRRHTITIPSVLYLHLLESCGTSWYITVLIWIEIKFVSNIGPVQMLVCALIQSQKNHHMETYRQECQWATKRIMWNYPCTAYLPLLLLCVTHALDMCKIVVTMTDFVSTWGWNEIDFLWLDFALEDSTVTTATWRKLRTYIKLEN